PARMPGLGPTVKSSSFNEFGVCVQVDVGTQHTGGEFRADTEVGAVDGPPDVETGGSLLVLGVGEGTVERYVQSNGLGHAVQGQVARYFVVLAVEVLEGSAFERHGRIGGRV